MGDDEDEREEAKAEEAENETAGDDPSSSSSSSTTIEEFDKEEERKKRRRLYRRHYYRRTHPFIRIPSTDIRKQLPTVWINVYNQCSPSLFFSFMRYLAHKDIVLGSTGWESGGNGYVVTYIPLIRTELSMETFVGNYRYACAVSDDMTSELRGCEIRRSSVARGTKVALNVRIIYTIMYELDNPVDRSMMNNNVSDLIPYRKLSAKPMKIFPLFIESQSSVFSLLCFVGGAGGWWSVLVE
eukprot:scaffold33_cov164-Ochromonas_danica.AAC.2